MSAGDDLHLSWITRLLRGEIINGEVGVRVRGGPFDGQTRIVELDGEGKPPATFLGRKGGGPGHRYRLATDGPAAVAWLYKYEGVEPDDASNR